MLLNYALKALNNYSYFVALKVTGVLFGPSMSEH
jgi:hypothetical protein